MMSSCQSCGIEQVSTEAVSVGSKSKAFCERCQKILQSTVGCTVKARTWGVLILTMAAVVGILWSAKSMIVDAVMSNDFAVTNSTAQARKACVETNDAEACGFAESGSYTRLRTLCAETLSEVVFSRVCPIGMIAGRDLEV